MTTITVAGRRIDSSTRQRTRQPRKRQTDFTLAGLGSSVWLLTPETRRAQAWAAENIQADLTLGSAIAIEPRCGEAILYGIAGAGFSVNGREPA